MHPVRILIISNRYFLCIGFSITKFTSKFRSYRRSIQGIVTFLLFNLAYLMCLYEHYSQRVLFETMKDLSKTMYYSMYTHLFLGMVNMLAILLEIREYSVFSNRIVDALPKNKVVRTNFDRMELFVYYRSFINLGILLCLVSYDLTIIDLKSLTRSKAMMFLALYYPHCAIAHSLRYFTIQMALLKSIGQHLNKKLRDIQLAHEFKHSRLYFEYLKSENIPEDKEISTITTSTSSRPISIISTKFQDLQIQDSLYFKQWWQTVRKRTNSSVKTDVIQMLDAIQSNEYLLQKLNDIFSEYQRFMIMYRKLERLIQKQFLLLICQHTLFVIVAIHISMEIYLEWGELMDEKFIKLTKVNLITHLGLILNDFGCLVLTTTVCRNEIRNTKNISAKLMGIPFCDNVRYVVSYFHFKLQDFEENMYAFNLFKINGYTYFMVILHYTVISCLYALYQYFDIKFENLQSTVDSMNVGEE